MDEKKAVSLDDPAYFRLVFEQALLPVTLDAMWEQLTIPVLMAWLDLVEELKAAGAIDPARLAARLQASAGTCPDTQQQVLLQTLAGLTVPPASPAGGPRTDRRSALRLAWSAPGPRQE